MNGLCQVEVLSEDKLFATLDSTYRTLNPDSQPPMVLIDTVGFIQNLPNTLVEGFRTTLESALEADLLIVVCNLSDPNYKQHLKVTQDVLDELNIKDKDQIVVFTHKDKIKDPFFPKIAMRNLQASFLMDSLNPEDLLSLREYVINYFLSKQELYDIFVPYANGDVHSKVMANTNIVKTENHESGIYYKIRVPSFIFNKLALKDYILAPESDLKRD